MSKYIEEGYCIQEGIPTPDKPIEIKTKVIGKNLLETVEYAQQKEIERLHSIIKEVRQYINNENYKEENICMINGVKILEILDKVDNE